MSDDIKGRKLDRLYSAGHRLERRPHASFETLGKLDKACRSVPPGGPVPKRYSRDLVGELFADFYGEDGTASAEVRTDEAQRVVVARKPRSSGDEGRGGGANVDPSTDYIPRKKRGFFGFGRG